MEEIPVTLKGTPQGILLTPRVDDWAAILRGLTLALQDADAFFRGGRVIVELGARTISHEQLVALRELLEAHEMDLWAILTDDPTTMRVVRSYGIRTRLPAAAAAQREPLEPTEAEYNAMLVQRTLRSGQRIHYPGHIIIVGDINPGAEVVAGGSIIVWGHIRGLVHAGALGDESAVICALDLAPAQLRIAGYISRTPEERRRKTQPEIASISQNRIIAEPWTARG
ncbi:MAG: septum site-determining protein MinC [Anaerolineae bacterium]|nr:septum site-determining protein MinC [Anaerolineae bacterium]